MGYNFLDLGLIDYARAYQLQKNIWNLVYAQNLKGIVILAEHNHTFTLGRSASASNILINSEKIKQEKIEVYNIERGGDVTYHGPGQIVAYPILNLKYHRKDVQGYVWDLEEVIIKFLQLFGIQGVRKEGFHGVWTQKGKIASLGVAIRKWISFHGLSININPQKKYFSYIKPCGLEAKIMTSLTDFLGEDIFKYNFKAVLRDSFKQVFN